MESLMFLVEKARLDHENKTCAKGNIQCNYSMKEAASSPTEMTQHILITAGQESRHDDTRNP